MTASQTNKVLQHLRRTVLRRDGAGRTDGQLLEDYLSRRDEAALAALVRRHGPMVWGVCRRVLGNYHDAEDAFQATFLVLIRKAASIASPALLANWLYGVAHQTALKARATTAKRRARERQVTQMPEPAVTEQDLWSDLQPLLDQELSRLPDIYRVAIVLCDLQGKTRKEAARQLGVPEGTLAARLARGRVKLAKRLARHGLAVSGGSLAAVLAQSAASASVPTAVESSTIKAASLFAAGQAAAGVISVKVAALTEGVLKTMLLSKLKIATALVLAALLAASGAGLIPYRALARGQAESDKQTVPPAAREAADQPASAPTPLKEAVEDLNRRAVDYLRPWVRQGTLAEDRLSPPVTVEEVVAAIRGWDRKKVPDAEAPYYRIFQEIAETKTLPPGAKLGWHTQWVRPDETDKFEHYVWFFRLDLELKIGKYLGHGFLVRKDWHRLWSQPAPAPGYTWQEGPIPVTRGRAGQYSDNVVSVETGKDGALVVAAGWSHRKGAHDVRVVAFDAEGNRHLPARDLRWGGATPEFAMVRFRLDPAKLPAQEVRHVGLEAVTGDGLKQVSKAALKRAKEKGVQVLPLPEVGKPYEFALTTADDKAIDSRTLRGKVVLIDCWASWCEPCLREMPDVKKVYEKWHAKGLEVIGLSFDEDPKAAAAAAKKHELPWPLVVVPASEEARELWNQAARIMSIPRLLLIDQQGVLRADLSSAQELEKTVAVLLADGPPPRPGN